MQNAFVQNAFVPRLQSRSAHQIAEAVLGPARQIRDDLAGSVSRQRISEQLDHVAFQATRPQAFAGRVFDALHALPNPPLPWGLLLSGPERLLLRGVLATCRTTGKRGIEFAGPWDNTHPAPVFAYVTLGVTLGAQGVYATNERDASCVWLGRNLARFFGPDLTIFGRREGSASRRVAAVIDFESTAAFVHPQKPIFVPGVVHALEVSLGLIEPGLFEREGYATHSIETGTYKGTPGLYLKPPPDEEPHPPAAV